MAANEEIKKIENVLIRGISTILSLEEDITSTTPLASVGMDSIRFVEVLIFIEERFDVELVKAQFTRDDVKDVASLARSIYSVRSDKAE